MSRDTVEQPVRQCSIAKSTPQIANCFVMRSVSTRLPARHKPGPISNLSLMRTCMAPPEDDSPMLALASDFHEAAVQRSASAGTGAVGPSTINQPPQTPPNTLHSPAHNSII